jgi:integrase
LRWEVGGLKRNPAKDVPLFEENNQRERYLSAEEFERLRCAIEHSQNPLLRWIVPMLVLTGARKREVLDARWCDFDAERKTWRIPMSKSGKARYVPLSEAVLKLLASIPRQPEVPWVFANPKTGKPFANIFHSWDTARCEAGLADVRMHDLRHSFASFLINGGRTLYEVQQILGHSQSRTTQRYAHLSQETLLVAVNTAAKALQHP